MTRRRLSAGLLPLLLAQPAAAPAWDRSAPPAEFDTFAPLHDRQAFSVREMYDHGTVLAIAQALSQHAIAAPDDARAWEVLCQWSYLLWRTSADGDPKLRAAATGARAARELRRIAPGGEAARIWPTVFLSLEGLTRGVLSMLNRAPQLRVAMAELAEAHLLYFHAYAMWSYGRLYYKIPPFPIAFGDIAVSEHWLEQALAAEPNFSLIALLLAETKAALGEHGEYAALLDRIPTIGYRTYFAKYAHWMVLAEAEALRRVIAEGSYDKYTWDPLLVPVPPPPADW